MKKLTIILGILCLVFASISVVYIRNHRQMRRFYIDTIHVQLGRVYLSLQRAAETEPDNSIRRTWDFINLTEETARLDAALFSLTMHYIRSHGGAGFGWDVRPRVQYLLTMTERDVSRELLHYAQVIRELMESLSLEADGEFIVGFNMPYSYPAPVNPDYSIRSADMFHSISRASAYISGRSMHR